MELTTVLGIVIFVLVVAVVVLALRGNRRRVQQPPANNGPQQNLGMEVQERIINAGRNLNTRAKKGAAHQIATLVREMIDFSPQRVSLTNHMARIKTFIDDYDLGAENALLSEVYEVLMDNHMSKQAAQLAKDYQF